MKKNYKKKRPTKKPPRQPNSMWVLLALLVGVILYVFWQHAAYRNVKQISHSKFVVLVEQDKVEKVTVQDTYVFGVLRQNGVPFSTNVLPSDKLWESLKKHQVNIEVLPPDGGSWGATLLLLLLLGGLIFFVILYLRQNQSGGSGGGAVKIFNVGKSKARFFSPNTVNVTFKDVAGVEEAKDALQDVIEYLKRPERFKRLGAKIPKGILLNGAPGNGKTLLAKAVAGEASCPFFSISGSDFVEVFVGVGASRVRDLFVQARKHAPCIVFIDEIDAVGRQRGFGHGGGNDEREQTLNQLLAEMDGFSTEHGSIIVLAATNRPDVLDKALLRPGRFDRIVEVPFPDLAGREKILGIHARKVKLASDVDLKQIARGTPGFSGAYLESLINEAALSASKLDKKVVGIDDFEEARERLILGSERKTMVISKKERKRTAYHEAGHALLTVLLEDADLLHKVSIVPRGRALGVSWSLPKEDRYNEGEGLMRANIAMSLGGLLAEKLVFNEQTSGASNDIEQATKVARRMVCRYGMSKLGPIVFGSSQDHPYLGRDLLKHDADYSQETAKRIDAEISAIIDSCYKRGEHILSENRDKLDILAENLLEKETLDAQEVYDLLGLEPQETHSFKPKGETGAESPESVDGEAVAKGAAAREGDAEQNSPHKV